MVERLLATSSGGRIVREGLKTVIIGKPNVGKSSCLMHCLGEQGDSHRSAGDYKG